MARRRRPANDKRPLLDILVSRFPEQSRDSLYRRVMCGEVRVDGGVETDPKAPVNRDATITFSERRFVSRGGDKLEAAMTAWNVEAAGRVWLDAGASTGGFTDCLLQRGAVAVHAVDVGYNQLDFRLRRDPRVYVRERTNVGDLSAASLEPPPAAAVCDLSFRSLRGALPGILRVTREGWGIALLKPQFELAAEARWSGTGTDAALDAGGGVVSGDARDAVVRRVQGQLADDGVVVHRMIDSPVAGREGNREVLLLVGLFASVVAGISSADPAE